MQSDDAMQPDYWRQFISDNELAGREAVVPEEADLSGLGIELEFLDEAGTRQEAQELYPGITVCRDGFVPVGGCAFGSGDPYFTNLRDGENGPLYRVYHDEVGEHGYDPARAIVAVLRDYRELVRYVAGRRTSG
jgi:hypothetical protein